MLVHIVQTIHMDAMTRKLGFHKYLNAPRSGIDCHTPQFMRDMITNTKLALVQVALAVVAIKLIPNRIQEVHLYHLINHSTL
jgi:hypothetical protein